MGNRDFIQETINSLSKSSKEIDKIWKQFQKGKINKEEFESQYRHILGGWLSEIKHEEYHPNNGCKYNQTCPTSKYFKEQKI